jgi:hypothetical protein
MPENQFLHTPIVKKFISRYNVESLENKLPTPNMKILKILLKIALMSVGMGCHSHGSPADAPVTMPTIPEIHDVQRYFAHFV